MNHSSYQLKGFIFDLYGTLVESKLNFSAIKAELGCPAEQDLIDFMKQLPPSQRNLAEKTVEEYEWQDALDSRIIPGVREFLSWLQQHNIACALVTRNSRRATEHKLKSNNLSFDIVLTRECAPPKPNPDALLSILRQWQVSANEVAYVGDYRYDIEAAHNAQMLAFFFGSLPFPDYARQAQLSFACWHKLPEQLKEQRYSLAPLD
ncbi:HAD family hydrolase [Pleionea litopenaei]|uniref:HAD-IA family hydrolase n=1 Tax=Pleionea litopenaei TaxID=3070815 RepID=A0AA51RSU3_9GAMM|nr:HAD-IA family hydrolase [Pleionea sp. HL-JVS1]WMS86863.1 HAD-IA family hydrolase [Pleionea sp. HL-JVS1]